MNGIHRAGTHAAVLFTLLLLLGAAVAAGQDGEVAKQGTFEGDWSLEGNAQAAEAGGKTVSLFRVGGEVKIESDAGLARRFDGECIGVSIPETGGVGRCVWIDAEDDKIFFEIGGEIVGPMGTSREASGSVIGGTGRYAGIVGSWDLEWIFVESALDDSKFKGYVTKLEGRFERP